MVVGKGRVKGSLRAGRRSEREREKLTGITNAKVQF